MAEAAVKRTVLNLFVATKVKLVRKALERGLP